MKNKEGIIIFLGFRQKKDHSYRVVRSKSIDNFKLKMM